MDVSAKPFVGCGAFVKIISTETSDAGSVADGSPGSEHELGGQASPPAPWVCGMLSAIEHP